MRFTDGMITLPLLPLLIVLGAVDLTKLGFSAEFAHSGAAGFWRIVVIIAHRGLDFDRAHRAGGDAVGEGARLCARGPGERRRARAI